MSARQIPNTGWIVDPRLDESQDLVVVTEPELVQSLEPDHAKQFVILETLEGAEAIEVVATILAGGEQNLASFHRDEAVDVVRGLGDHFRGEGS